MGSYGLEPRAPRFKGPRALGKRGKKGKERKRKKKERKKEKERERERQRQTDRKLGIHWVFFCDREKESKLVNTFEQSLPHTTSLLS